MVKLRDYQIKAVDSVFKAFKEVDHTLLVQATGTGKTIVFSEIAKQALDNGKNVLILAHREELINQAQDKLFESQGLIADIEKAEKTTSGNPLVIGSVQTLTKDKRLNLYENEFFDLIIIDEAHHATANSYVKILDYFDGAKVLGVTATPFRSDKTNLTEVFDSICFEYSLIQAIDEGYLTPITTELIPLKIDLGNVKVRAGDFALEDLDNSLEPYLEAVADTIAKKCINRKTVIFLPLVKTSQKLNEMLLKRGIKSEEVNGKSIDRKEILERFESGETKVLCNSMLLTEGWDSPSVDCIINLRPTKSESLYMQIIGRGTRLYPGKKELLVLDFLWQSDKHDLCKPATLIATSKEQVKEIDKILLEKGSGELKELQEEAKDRIVQRSIQEDALRKSLIENSYKVGRKVNPIKYSQSIRADDLIDYEPSFMWEKEPPSEKQLKFLAKNGFSPADIPNKGFASKLTGRIMERIKKGLASPKQIRLLEDRGFVDVDQWSKNQANNMIGNLKRNNWRMPRGFRPSEYRPC